MKFLFIGGPQHGNLLDVGNNDSKFIEIPDELVNETNDGLVRNRYKYELANFAWAGVAYPVYVYLSLAIYDPRTIAELLSKHGYLNEEDQ